MRKVFFTIHLWLGLSLGLVTVLLGLTGSLLVFRHEIDAALAPNLLTVSPRGARVEPPQLVAAARAAFPTASIETLNMPGDTERPAEFWLKGGDRVYVDPYSGKILGKRNEQESLMGKIFHLHTELLSGESGKQVAGLAGISLVLLSLTGLIVWWPRKNQRFTEGMKVKRSSRKRLTYDLHRAVGFWSCGLLLLVGLTGAGLVFPDHYKALIYAVAGKEPPGKPRGAKSPSQPLQELLASAARAMPEGDVARIAFPKRAGDPLVIRKRTPNEIHPNGMNYIYVDPGTAKVLRVDRDTGNELAASAMNLRYPLHTGVYGGLLTRILHAFLGMVPLLLAITGGLVWLRKRRKALARNRQSNLGAASVQQELA